MERTPTAQHRAKQPAVLEALRTGMSIRDAATQHGVPKSTVGRWAKLLEADAPEPTPILPAPKAPSPEDPPDASTDALTATRTLHRQTISLAEEARRVGNVGAAQRAMRDAAALVTVIARLEKAERQDGDVLRISRAEIVAAQIRQRERLRALLERPLLCAHCGRALSVDWGEGGAK